MRMDFNEEEIDTLLQKLYAMKTYKKIINLGYEYKKERILTLVAYDAYGNLNSDIIDFLSQALEPVFDKDNGDMDHFHYENIELFKNLGIEIPYLNNDYTTNEPYGFYINIDNEYTKKYIELDLNHEKEYMKFFDYIDMCEELSYEYIRVVFDKKTNTGMYIIIPDHSSYYINEIFDGIADTLEKLYQDVREANK